MTTQERIERAQEALATFRVDRGFDATEYDNAGDALRKCIDDEDNAWGTWRDNGKSDELRRVASDIQGMWSKRARAIANVFPDALQPDDVILYFEALMAYSKPLPPELQRVVDSFSKPTFTSRTGRVYGERAINSIKHYAIAVSVFDDYRDELGDAIVEYAK